ITVTINGPVLAPPRQIFAGSGTVSFGSSSPTTTFYPEWWGTNTTPGTTDMTAAIQAAIAACESAGVGDVILGHTTYAIASGLVVDDDNVLLIGAGKGSFPTNKAAANVGTK